ncbi:hypothetical protein GS503_09320 [Rhodococcus hoagii]|nr:hypothetical protein [Prescottella equi]
MDSKVRRLAGLVRAGSAVLAMLPGFVLPFVVATRLDQASSDTFLLVVSIALVLINVLGNAIEINSVVFHARVSTADQWAARTAYYRSVLLFAGATVLTVGVGLVALYALDSGKPSDVWICGSVILVAPMVGAVSSILAGRLIAAGQSSSAIATQVVRMGTPLAVVVALPMVSVLGLVCAYLAGEVLRLTILCALVRRTPQPMDGAKVAAESDSAPAKGLVWQSLSAATAQSGPVTDRIFLNGAPAGSITAYEIADKFFFAALQFLNLTFLVARVGEWAKYTREDGKTARRAISRGITSLTMAGSVVALAGSSACLVVVWMEIVPTQWRSGVMWAAVLFLSLPFSLLSYAAVRLLVIVGRSELLIRFAVANAIANAVLDYIAFLVWGPIGVPIATAVLRVFTCAAYFVVIRRQLRTYFGASAEPPRERELV